MKKQVTLISRVQTMMADHPEWGGAQIAKALKANLQSVYTSISLLKKRNATEGALIRVDSEQNNLVFSGVKAVVQQSTEIDLRIKVPDAGIKLQLTNGKGHAVGTLLLSTSGLTFLKPNAKQKGKTQPRVSYKLINFLQRGALDMS